MVIHLYEEIINEDGTRSPDFDRLVAEVRCKGDGTPGEIIYYDICNELWTVKDANHYCYNKDYLIFDDYARARFDSLLNESADITTGGGWNEDRTVHYTEGKTVRPWHREALEYIVEYGLNSSICGGTVYAKIVEP